MVFAHGGDVKDIERKDIWDYPIPAIREAVLNSLIHRDYFNVANFALLKIYDDHFWVSNPGKLPAEITVEELKQPHKLCHGDGGKRSSGREAAGDQC